MHQRTPVTPTSARPSLVALMLGVAIAAVVFVSAAAILTLSLGIFTLLAAILDAVTVIGTLSAIAAIAAFLAVYERERRRAERYAKRRSRIMFERSTRELEIEDPLA